MIRPFVVALVLTVMAGPVAAGEVAFKSGPTVKKAGGAVKISFAVSAPTDVEVAVLAPSGKVVRHLAAGVLGGPTPPPAPLAPGLSQALSWDGKDDTGKDLIISRDYISQGMRERASELATEWLGPRTELEIQRSMTREVNQERWTGLDRTLQREAVDGLVHTARLEAQPRLQRQRLLLVGRLQRLQRMGLASEMQTGVWAVHADAESTLRAMGERGDIIRTMQRAMRGKQRELAVFQPGEDGRTVVGRVAGKGLADELYDKGYLIVDGADGKAHYVTLPSRTELEQYPTGAVVEVKGATAVRAADKIITALTVDGIYRSDHHLAVASAQPHPDRHPHEVVEAHVRRLEALRRAGLVERQTEGVWQVPQDLPERGRQYDAQRLGGVAVELKSHLPIERQARVIGATWLDQQLIGGG
ncbi:hypothetical protein LCGC14_2373060, partial [marine sediment metagenome]